MSFFYKQLDFQPTPIGDLMLRRRRMPQFGDTDIYEVKLGEHFLMTSLFHEAESQLAILGLKEIERKPLDVMVGGLGLGYTAVEALKDPRIESLVIIDYLAAVIGWHESELVPLGKTLNDDARCELKNADFFELIRNEPSKRMDVILLDIDHTPTHVLHQTNTHFYTEAGLTEMAQHLKPDGVFAMWADGAPDEAFRAHLQTVFPSADAHTIKFDNPITGSFSVGAVYVAKKSLIRKVSTGE
jgi:spermidine synthase